MMSPVGWTRLERESCSSVSNADNDLLPDGEISANADYLKQNISSSPGP